MYLSDGDGIFFMSWKTLGFSHVINLELILSEINNIENIKMHYHLLSESSLDIVTHLKEIDVAWLASQLSELGVPGVVGEAGEAGDAGDDSDGGDGEDRGEAGLPTSDVGRSHWVSRRAWFT